VSESNSDFVKKNYVKYSSLIKAVTFVHNHGIFGIEKKFEDKNILDSLEHINKNYPVNKLEHIIEKIHLKLAIIFLKFNRKKNIIPCDVLQSSIHLMPNGDIKPCMFMNSLGNIKKQSLSEILNAKETLDTKKQIKENKCPKCWMNCYSPHSIMQNPIQSLKAYFFS